MRPTRRAVLIASASIALVPPATATPAMLEEAIRGVIGEGKLQQGRVTLDMPPLVENGNAVPLSVRVESPMTAQDHVRAIHVFNEKNPQQRVNNPMVCVVPSMAPARPSYRFEIARKPCGHWIAHDRDGLAGGTFTSRKDAVRFALSEARGDSAQVFAAPDPAEPL